MNDRHCVSGVRRRNLRLLVAYEGTSYHGWERQIGLPSVQATIESAIERLTGAPTRVLASGRTDAGVHALGQCVSFRTESALDGSTFVRALNALLPDDIRVRSADDAPAQFHPIHHAIGKLYRYVIHDGPVVPPLLRRFVYHSRRRLCVDAMHAAAETLAGTHDFSSFESAGAPRPSSVRTITHIAVLRAGVGQMFLESKISAATADPDSDFVYLEVAADGFLYNMVRSIAGTLMNVGRQCPGHSSLREILASRERSRAGPTAPARGLMLVSVAYDWSNLPSNRSTDLLVDETAHK